MSEKVRTYAFAGVLCLISSILLTVAASGLKERQDKNIAIDRQKNILKSVGLIEEEHKYSAETIEKLYSENIRNIRTDTEGKILKADEHAPKELPLYLYVKGDEVRSYIIPIETQGLWGTIYGYLSLKNDGATVAGFTVYQHSETPGLGGEIEKRWFQKNFEGKKITDHGGDLVSVAVAKGAVKDIAQEKQSHYVDGIGGATLTGKFLTSGLKNILQEYEPVAVQFRKNKNVKFER